MTQNSPWAEPALFGALVLAAWAVSLLVRNATLAMLVAAGHIRPNYAGQQIPMSAGVILTLVSIAFASGLAVFHLVSYQLSLAYCVLILGFGFIGLIDDVMGSRDKSGLRGHLMSLVRGEGLTTGALKALYGGLVALLASGILGGQPWAVLLRAGVLALSANSANLLDLRPGRAIKGFIVAVAGSALVAAASGLGASQGWLAMGGLLGAVLAYAPTDFRARAMMGDAGSNVLGVAAGFSAALVGGRLGTTWLCSSLAVLVAIHVYAERASISRAIEGNRVLRAIDGLGREKK